MEAVTVDARNELEAVFLFSGGGLFVGAEVLGKRFQVDHDATAVTVILPDIEDTPRELAQISGHVGSKKSAHIVSRNPHTAELLTAVIDTFELRVGVAPGDRPLKSLVEDAFPVAVEVAERFLSWMRTTGGQYWLPSSQGEVEPAGIYGRLVLPGTYEEIDPEARWFPPLVARHPDEAAKEEDIDAAISQTRQGFDPPPEDVLLADAQRAASLLSVDAMCKLERRDTARVVLLAAMAIEVKLKRALRDNAPHEFRDLLDVILDNPRAEPIAGGQLLDNLMKAAIGVSLRDADKLLFRDVIEHLFLLRNRAHYAYEPTLNEAQEALSVAVRMSGWLDRIRPDVLASVG